MRHYDYRNTSALLAWILFSFGLVLWFADEPARAAYLTAAACWWLLVSRTPGGPA